MPSQPARQVDISVNTFFWALGPSEIPVPATHPIFPSPYGLAVGDPGLRAGLSGLTGLQQGGDIGKHQIDIWLHICRTGPTNHGD